MTKKKTMKCPACGHELKGFRNPNWLDKIDEIMERVYHLYKCPQCVTVVIVPI